MKNGAGLECLVKAWNVDGIDGNKYKEVEDRYRWQKIIQNLTDKEKDLLMLLLANSRIAKIEKRVMYIL